MAEEMAELREEAAVVAQQRDAAAEDAERLAMELEHLQAEWADDSAALKVCRFPCALTQAAERCHL